MTRFKKCVKAHRDGCVRLQHGNRGKKRMSLKSTKALGWMRQYFGRIGDFMLHNSKVHLPDTWKKGEVYQKMKTTFLERGVLPKNIISASHFFYLWSQHLPEYVIAKKSEFSKCSTCTNLETKFKEAKTKIQQDEVIKLKKDHDDKVEAERTAYHVMRERARLDPDLFTVMIIDGMDQSKTNLPLLTKDKDTGSLARLHVHLTGVLLHTKSSEGKIPYIYTDVKEIPHDANTTINVLVNTLMEHKDKLGETLFLQLDNCYRENKNKYLLSFASLLVELEVFKKVIIHFLPVGHTHEDVDQMFSRIAVRLEQSNGVFTLVDLEDAIKSSYTPTISVRSATPQFDYKDWMGPHMAGNFHNHSQPHWFRFTMTDGQARMHYKMWATDAWLPEVQIGADGHSVERDDSRGLLCLKSLPDLHIAPEWVIPSLDKLEVDELKKDLPKSYGMRLPRDKQVWWTDYINNLESLTEVPDHAPATWSIEELAYMIRSRQPVWEQDDELEQIRRRIEVTCPVVTVGRQGIQHERAVQHVDSYKDLKVGDFVVVNLEDCTEPQPYIGKVLTIEGSNVKIHWMDGRYNKAWTEMYSGVANNRKPDEQMIPMESILLFGFTLTYKKRLHPATVVEIKSVYNT